MSLTFEQQLNILSYGHRIDLENGFSHYHFIGAPFCGLYKKKTTKNQEFKKIGKKVEAKVPLKVSFDNEEGWKMVYEIAELNIGQTYLVEEIVKRQRRFLVERVKNDDPFDPHPYINKLDDELLFALQATSVLESMAKQRNKLIHSLNGNIDSIQLYPLDQMIIDYKNSYCQKNFYYINDFGDTKDFTNLNKNLVNLCIDTIMPENLTPIFYSLENKYKLELNLGNEYANYLNQLTNNHPLGIFRNKIINEYLTPIDTLYRYCPYCTHIYEFNYLSNEYSVSFYDQIIAYLPDMCTETNKCRNCNKNIIFTRNYEYVDILKLNSSILTEKEYLEQCKNEYNEALEREERGRMTHAPYRDVKEPRRRNTRKVGPNEEIEVFRNMVEQMKFEEVKDFVTSIPNILSYQEVMEKLKPINTITSIFNIYHSKSAYHALSEVLRLLETHNLYWNFDTDKLITCIDCICSLLKNIRDVPELISQIPGMDRISFLPGRDNQNVNQFPNMREELFEVNEDGFLAKALKFAEDFGVDQNILKSCGAVIALLTTTVASIALIGCGSKINSFNLTSGISSMIHTMAIECKDWKVLLSSLKDTWEFIASALGKFLGFTYMDSKTAIRKDFITKYDQLKTDIDELEDAKVLNYAIINDPAYFNKYFTRYTQLDELTKDMARTDSVILSYRTDLAKLKTRISVIKDDYTSLFNSKCGKQQPTTIYIGSELSGIGKTSFMEWCVEPLSLKYGRALTKYVKGTEDYWSNYVYQDILHWRDFNQKKTHEEHIELINIYDPSPTQLNMSDNNEKGRQFKSRFMFIDSNTLYIRRSVMIDDASKLDRRRDFVFEAFTQFRTTPNKPTPESAEEAINNLYLVSMPRIKQENGSAEFNTEYFTVDGRQIMVGNNQIATLRFDVIIDRLHAHETRNHEAYFNKCQRIFEAERQRQMMVPQVYEPAISQIEAESKKVILLIGAPGTGKTTLARKFNNLREDGDFKYDEFTIQNTPENIRKYILESYDKGNKDVILTANVTDYEPWINSLNVEQRDAILRRCIKIDVNFAMKKSGWLKGYLTNPIYYTKEEVEDEANKSLYSRMVAFNYKGMNIKITGASKMIEDNLKKDIKNVISYDNTPRIKINKELAKNLVEFDMFWKDVDEISQKSIFELMQITKIVRTTLPYTVITKAFAQIVYDVFQNYTLNADLEEGLNQLNSLRLDSPLDFDCVVKLRDEAFFLTTDDDGKIVFCICDDSFEYKVDENNDVLCYFNGEFLWKVEGRVATWYRHIQRNVDLVAINYANFTPPSRDLVKYCDYFLNFLKTGFAALAIKELCTKNKSQISEEMYDTYDQSFTNKPNSFQSNAQFNKVNNTNYSNPNTFRPVEETSADAYQHQTPKQNTIYVNTNKFKFKEIGDETSADAYQHVQQKQPKITTKNKSNFTFTEPIKKVSMENEACLDIQSAQLADIVMNQNYPLFVGSTQVCFGQGFFKNYMLTVGHLSGEVKVKINNVLYATKVLAIDEVRDLAIIKVIGKSISFKDIRKYFQRERVNNSVEGFKATLYCRSPTGNIYEKPITLKEQKILEIRGNKVKDGLLYNVHSLEGNHPIQTQAGFCGSPMLICNSAYPEKILGLHVAADDVHGLTSVVFKSDLEFEEMEEQSLIEQSITVLPFQQVVIENLELPVGLKTPLRCVGRAGVYKNDLFYSNSAYSSDKTQIYPSPFSTDDPCVFEPSVLSEKDPRLEIPCENILYKGLNKFAKEQKEINLQYLDECVEELSEVLLEGIRRTGMQSKILTMDEVINGCKYYSTSPSLNMSSGVGYPHSYECGGMTHKADAFFFNIDTCKYEFAENEKGQQILSDFTTYLEHLKTHEGRTAVIYVAQKKDEVLKIKKIKDCGTRIFEMGPLYHFMAMKQYFGAAQALLTYVNSSIPFKIGINASSHEYAKLHKYLLKTGDLGMNCDYTGFDSSHPKEFLERYHKIYNNIYKETDPNWKQEDDDIRRKLHEQENCPLVLVDDLIIECPGGLMSGGEDTGGKNNIAGNLNMRYAWKVLAAEHCPEKFYKYDEFTTDATFGDDLIKTIRSEVLSWYNPFNIQDVLNKIGFTITSADKETELTIQPLNELTFLKRSFEYIEVNLNGAKQKFLVGALEDNCFLKMLNWCKASKRYKYRRTQRIHYDPSTIGLSALTCLAEASLKGKETFNRTRQHLVECSKKFSMVLPKLPTFEQAFFETYFCSTFPKIETKQIINIPYSNELHPLYPREFDFAGRSFINIMHCYEYTRAKCHQQEEKAEYYYDNPTKCKYVYYPDNVRFKPDRLMFKIIKHVFKNYNFKNFTNNHKFIVDYGHKYFGFEVGDAITNKYGELLSEFAISKLPKENLQSENNTIIEYNNNNQINSDHKINCPISKENIIFDSDLLIEPNSRFNTKTWTTAEITPLSQK
jgi:energy-coupling factor transporter ATP-binding protein EcfA2